MYNTTLLKRYDSTRFSEGNCGLAQIFWEFT